MAGYFETVLYRDIELSTNPVTMDSKSANMISWFPIFFPLKVSIPISLADHSAKIMSWYVLTRSTQTPLGVPENGEIVVTMYRQTDDRKVWYEWMVEVFVLERTVESPSSGAMGPVMSGARADFPAGESATSKDKQQQQQRHRGGPRRIKVGMSDLHSSIKEGCLM